MSEIEKLQLFKDKGFTYNPETGEVFSPTGKLQKTIDDLGYIRCSIRVGDWRKKRSLRIRGHRLAWFLYHGDIDSKLQVDHINGKKNDNRITNLRLVTNGQNQFNKKCVKGYYYHKRDKKYYSVIRYNKNTLHLGSFDTEGEAKQAYLDAKKKYHII